MYSKSEKDSLLYHLQEASCLYNSTPLYYAIHYYTTLWSNLVFVCVQVDAVLFYAITSLHNMLLHYDPAKMDVRLAGRNIDVTLYSYA